jgi:DNA-binding response OmpR family regulator
MGRYALSVMSSPALAARPKIVVADDDTAIRTLVKRALLGRFEIIEAHDGIATLESIERHQPALVICDVMMPALDGFSILKRVRQSRLKDTPFLFLTAKGDARDHALSVSLGAQGHMTKPFKAAELLAQVEHILSKQPSE